MIKRVLLWSSMLWVALPGLMQAQGGSEDLFVIREHYAKKEYRIPMRDGARLFTAVYTPKDTTQIYPIMLYRTPYSVSPYGEGKYKQRLGPSELFAKEEFIFVYQDVRGRFMSEGEFVNMRPQIDEKKSSRDIDESSDTYDTIDWLVKNLRHHNGKVGMWGISYPGFYATVGSIDAHPALVAVSPQAPIADWFWDDFHHHGAFFLPHAFNFLAIFGQPRPEPTTRWGKRFQHGTPDGYKFFLEYLGPLKNANKKYFKNKIKFWNDIVKHPNYDAFWQARSLPPHLKNIKPAVMVVGGWFDAEDLYGALKNYATIEENSPGAYNTIVMGPWSHGGWARTDGTKLGRVFFTDSPPPSKFYQNEIEFPFFMHFLKGQADPDLPEAYMFETGTNVWRRFDTWPPDSLESKRLYLHEDGKLTFVEPEKPFNGFDEFISYPDKPVPYTETTTTGMTKAYMTDDQRFAARRPDVLVYQTLQLQKPITLAGKLVAHLEVSTTAGDADWVVKLIDVYPDNYPDFPHNPPEIKMGGYQQMVRSEVFRGRFRESYEIPKKFKPGEITTVEFELQDVLHTFKIGHRIMIQIQSTWFPLVDRNPQKWVDNIYKASEKDFIKATHRVYHNSDNASYIQVGVMK